MQARLPFSWLGLTLCCLLSLATSGRRAEAQEGKRSKPSYPTLVAALATPLATKDLQGDVSLKEVLLFIQDKFAAEEKEVLVHINEAAFLASNDGPLLMDVKVRFDAAFGKGAVHEILLSAANQCGGREAAILVRRGRVEITTKREASVSTLLRQKVLLHRVKQPLAEVLEDLTEWTGVSINIDPAVDAKVKVSATFVNDATVAGALNTLTAMAGLHWVDLRSSIYVTTPANAAKLKKDMQPRAEQPFQGGGFGLMDGGFSGGPFQDPGPAPQLGGVRTGGGGRVEYSRRGS